MALTWSVKDVVNYEEVTTVIATQDWPEDGTKKGDKLWNPVTTSLIWHSLNTGIGRITSENVAEVYARISLVEDLYGASLRRDGEDRPITKEDVQAHVGLSTNASFKDESRSSFLKRHAASRLDDSVREYQRWAEKQAAEKAEVPA